MTDTRMEVEVKQVMNGMISKVELRKKIAYIYNDELLQLADKLPKVKGRANLVHQLITAYGLHHKMICVKSEAASERELRLFHTEEYIEYIKSINEKIPSDFENSFNSSFNNDELGLSYDCSPLPKLYDTVSQIAGSTLSSIKAITQLKCDYVINWFGGWHHAKNFEASGYCYVNDIAIAILYLLQLKDNNTQRMYKKLDQTKENLSIQSPHKKLGRWTTTTTTTSSFSDVPNFRQLHLKTALDFNYEFRDENIPSTTNHGNSMENSINERIRVSPLKKTKRHDRRKGEGHHGDDTDHDQNRSRFRRILYIDLDLHHGDAVQDAFANTDRVLTVSFHKYETGFYPGTGCITDIGFGKKGKYHSLNVPLRDGLSDHNFEYVSSRVLSRVFDAYNPDLIITQCGADTMAHDPMNGFNLTIDSIGNCVRLIKSFSRPTIFLGGGGYHFPNTARLWTHLTSIILDEPISNDIPDHDHFLEYKPGYELQVQSQSHIKDQNSLLFLNQVLNRIDSYLLHVKMLRNASSL